MSATLKPWIETPAPETEKRVVSVERLTDASLHANDLYLAMLTRHVERRPGLAWLDVGCGWHLDWPWEHERERKLLNLANATGFDPDWQAISRHRTITKRVVGMVEHLPFADGSFDLVTANVVVEHLRHPAVAFAEVSRVLRRGGCFMFRTPSARNYFVRIARRLPQGLKVWLATRVVERRKAEDVYPAHYRANTWEEIEQICAARGFRNVRITITRPQGILASRAPLLARMERRAASAFGLTEGNLIVAAEK